MRSLSLALLLTAWGCAAAPAPTPRAAPPPLSLALAEGDRVEVEHDERVWLDGELAFERRTLLSLEVVGRRGGAAYELRGSISRVRADDPLARAHGELRFTWLPDGRVEAYPHASCVHDDGALELARFVRFTLGLPLEDRGAHHEIESWLDELPVEARARREALERGRVRIDVSAEDRLEGVDLGALRFDGTLRMRERFELDARSGVAGTIARRLSGPVLVLDRRGLEQHRATLRASMDTSLTHTRASRTKEAARHERDVADPCGRDEGIQRGMIRAVSGSRDAVRACYDEALRRDPSLNGRIDVRFGIVSPGHVIAAELVDSSLDDPALLRCVRDTLHDLDASPGPIAGSLWFVAPFVFTTQ